MPLTPEIESARTTAQTAQQALGELTAGGYTIGDELKKRIQEAYDYNKDIVGPLDTATLGYTGAPTEARNIFSNPESERYVFNPFQQEQLVSQYTQGKALPMLTLGNVLGQRMGRISDTIGAGTNAYNAQTARQQGTYNAAQQNYQNLLSEYQLSQPETTIIEANGRQLLINSKTGEIIQDLGAAPVSGGGSGVDYAALAQLLGLSNNQTTGTGSDLGNFWEEEGSLFDSLTSTEKRKVLEMSAMQPGKSVEQLAQQVINERGKTATPASGSVIGASGTAGIDTGNINLTYPSNFRF
jgi:hypothetical protein